MDVGDERHFGAFPDLFHRGRGVIVRHGDTYDLAASFDHLLDLADGAVDVSRVRLGHRLNNHRRTTADLNVPNFYWSRSTHLKELRNIQIHHKDHQHQDHGQAGELDPLLRRHGQSAPEPGHHFFEAEYSDLSTIK